MRRLTLAILLLLLPGFGLTCGQPSASTLPKIELTYWRVFDDEDAFAPIIKAYTANHPNISIRYRKFRYDEYEPALLNALAEDRGPDLFSIPNTWIGKFSNKLLPAPREVVTLERYIDSGPQGRELIRQRRIPGPTPASVLHDYVDSVATDVTHGNDVLGLPLGVDTLALFANTNLLAFAGISTPAKSWEELLEHTKKLRIVGKDGTINQAAVALGTADNIPRSQDILLTLMLQNGVELADSQGHVTLEKAPAGSDVQNPPAAEALRFYTDFAAPSKSIYTWNNDLPNALELFREGRLAYLLSYSYTAQDLATTAPKTRFTVNPMPQPQPLIDRNVRVALSNTWIEGVSRKSQHPNEAWDFLLFLTSPENASQYLTATKKPAALRAVSSAQATDPLLGVFAPQTLVSRSWYRGTNSAEMERALQRAITAVVNGTLDPAQAVTRAAQQIELTLQPNL